MKQMLVEKHLVNTKWLNSCIKHLACHPFIDILLLMGHQKQCHGYSMLSKEFSYLCLFEQTAARVLMFVSTQTYLFILKQNTFVDISHTMTSNTIQKSFPDIR